MCAALAIHIPIGGHDVEDIGVCTSTTMTTPPRLWPAVFAVVAISLLPVRP